MRCFIALWSPLHVNQTNRAAGEPSAPAAHAIRFSLRLVVNMTRPGSQSTPSVKPSFMSFSGPGHKKMMLELVLAAHGQHTYFWPLGMETS